MSAVSRTCILKQLVLYLELRFKWVYLIWLSFARFLSLHDGGNGHRRLKLQRLGYISVSRQCRHNIFCYITHLFLLSFVFFFWNSCAWSQGSQGAPKWSQSNDSVHTLWKWMVWGLSLFVTIGKLAHLPQAQFSHLESRFVK